MMASFELYHRILDNGNIISINTEKQRLYQVLEETLKERASMPYKKKAVMDLVQDLFDK